MILYYYNFPNLQDFPIHQLVIIVINSQRKIKRKFIGDINFMKLRTKAVAIAASVVVGVSMLGVGFASWVIANQSATGTASGNIKADSVSDSSTTLEITEGAAGQNIVFGAPSTQMTEDAWLTNDSDTTEALTATFKLTVSENIGNISVSLASTGYGDEDGFWKAVEEGYLVAPVVSISGSVAGAFSVQTGTLSEDGTVTIARESQTAITDGATITVTLTFGWGNKFGNKNPYNYYNGLDYETYHKVALSSLGTLYEYLNEENGLTYTVTFRA